MKKDLEKTGLFKVDVMRSAYTWGEDTLMIKEFTINGMPATEPNKSPFRILILLLIFLDMTW